MSKLERDIHEPFEDSKFADDDGNLFSVKSVYDFVESNPEKYLHKNFPLSKIEHNLEWWDSSYDINNPNDKNRVLKANLSYPLLVVKEKDGNLSVSDGLNRLYKAIKLKHLTHLPVYLVKKSEIEHLAINKGKNPIDMEKKKEVKEQGADSSGSYEGAAFGSVILKKDIHKLKNLPNAKSYNVNEEQEFHEDGIQSSGSFDVPAFGKTTKGGRRNPLKIDGPDSIYKGRAVTDKNFPRYGGPKGVFVKIKEKCKKFPYCNQGNTGAIEFIHEDQELQTAINETSKKYGIPVQEVEKIVLNEISKIFI